MDINELIDTTLAPLCAYYYERPETPDELPGEYIVYHRIYGNERNFADGKPVFGYHLYRINYYTADKTKITAMMSNIKNAMKSAGFYLQSDNITIPREANAEFYGAYSEFAFWEVLSDEI